MRTELPVISDKAQEIIALHNGILRNLRESLDMAIQLGGLLTEVKSELKHGEFGDWLKSTMPFVPRTARNYMKLWRNRDELKRKMVSDLTSAYRLLEQPRRKCAPDDSDRCSDRWWTEATAEGLRGLIDALNDDLGDPDCWLDPDATWFFEKLGGFDPNSEEDMATARRIEIKKHFCCARNMAWHRGMASLPLGWQELLKKDGIIPTEEPGKVCGGCWLL